LRMTGYLWVSRDGGIKQKTVLYGLSFGWGQWLNYKDCMQLKEKFLCKYLLVCPIIGLLSLPLFRTYLSCVP